MADTRKANRFLLNRVREMRLRKKTIAAETFLSPLNVFERSFLLAGINQQTTKTDLVVARKQRLNTRCPLLSLQCDNYR